MTDTTNTEIDPFDPQHHYKPMWAVYGDACFPSLLCCSVNMRSGALTIWGYSVWRGKPGFRTLGIGLRRWIDESDMRPRFYADQDAALDDLRRLTAPKVPK